MVLTALYMPVALMLAGLILRGVAFEFRAKAADAADKRRWDAALRRRLDAGGRSPRAGCSAATCSASRRVRPPPLFAALSAAGVAVAYAFIGACWLIWRTEGALQRQAVRWGAPHALGRGGGDPRRLGRDPPLASPRIFARWFEMPYVFLLAPLPLTTAALLLGLAALLRHMPLPNDALRRLPFWGATTLFCLAFAGPRLELLPLCRAGAADGLAGGERAGEPLDHPGRRAGRAAGDPGPIPSSPGASFGGKAADLKYY
jgi:cytochrome d ubiquinol oxidase subunit II